MNILAFDTAADVFSIGLSVDGKRPQSRRCYCLTVDGGQKHSELIMDGADTLLQTAGIAKTELEAVACMEGPGSFTGLRIGFSAAKGLALALGVPVIPVPTLDCMAAPFPFWPGIVVPVIDAKKNAFFTALYRQGKRLCGYLDIEIDGIINNLTKIIAQQKHPLLVTGPASHLVLDGLRAEFPGTVSDTTFTRGYAYELLNLAMEKVIINSELTDYSVGPLYLRKSDAELNIKMDKPDG